MAVIIVVKVRKSTRVEESSGMFVLPYWPGASDGSRKQRRKQIILEVLLYTVLHRPKFMVTIHLLLQTAVTWRLFRDFEERNQGDRKPEVKRKVDRWWDIIHGEFDSGFMRGLDLGDWYSSEEFP